MFFLMSSIFCRFSLHRKADEKQMCAVRPISMYREIHFNAARKKRNNSRWRLYRYFRLYRNKQHRTIDIYYTRVFSLLVSESFGVILDHTASRQFQCNDFSSIWRHTGNFAFDLNINDRWTFFTVENNGFSCGFLFVLWQTCRHSCKVRLKLSCTSCIYTWYVLKWRQSDQVHFYRIIYSRCLQYNCCYYCSRQLKFFLISKNSFFFLLLWTIPRYFWYFEFMRPRIKKIRGLLQALFEYKNAKNNRTTAYINDFTARIIR